MNNEATCQRCRNLPGMGGERRRMLIEVILSGLKTPIVSSIFSDPLIKIKRSIDLSKVGRDSVDQPPSPARPSTSAAGLANHDPPISSAAASNFRAAGSLNSDSVARI